VKKAAAPAAATTSAGMAMRRGFTPHSPFQSTIAWRSV
jgi:hypothetical protein